MLGEIKAEYFTVPRIVGVQEKRLARPIDRRSGGPCLHRISERGEEQSMTARDRER
jgi:hypothetical protein